MANVAMYCEHPFSESLKPYVAAIWSHRPEPSGASAVVLPDGCMDIVFSRDQGRTVSRIIGAMSRPLDVSSTGMSVHMGVRFRPGAATSFLPLCAEELTDQSCCVGDLRLDWLNRLQDRLETSAIDSPGLLEEALLEASRQAKPANLYVTAVCQKIESCKGFVSVEQLSSFAGVSRQYLSRLFRQHVGLSTKALSRVLRFQAAVDMAKRDRSQGWAEIAARFGYADQSHLVAEFRALAGMSPSLYLPRD